MLTEAPLNPKVNREKMVEIMFETHQVQGMYVAIQAVLSMYSNGRTTGTVCDSGYCVSHTVPVFEGFQIPHAVKSSHVAGIETTKHMIKLLVAEGIQ
jgi:actin, other eukaryote